MTEPQKVFYFRLITVNGIVVDFQSPNSLEAMWTLIRGDGCFQTVSNDGKPSRYIPFHAVASVEYLSSASALIYAPAVSSARN